jgi:hypothetical protein
MICASLDAGTGKHFFGVHQRVCCEDKYRWYYGWYEFFAWNPLDKLSTLLILYHGRLRIKTGDSAAAFYSIQAGQMHREPPTMQKFFPPYCPLVDEIVDKSDYN